MKVIMKLKQLVNYSNKDKLFLNMYMLARQLNIINSYDYVEFGVGRGHSLKLISYFTQSKMNNYIGFDDFRWIERMGKYNLSIDKVKIIDGDIKETACQNYPLNPKIIFIDHDTPELMKYCLTFIKNHCTKPYIVGIHDMYRFHFEKLKDGEIIYSNAQGIIYLFR